MLQKELFNLIKKELVYLGTLLLIAILIFKISFFRESFLGTLRVVLSLFWLFVLPGYAVMLYWNDKLHFIERFLIGIGVSAAIIGILSYYFGISGLNIKYHTILLPSLLIALGITITILKKTKIS